eukprot:4554583-Pyramimonas_sp.AAC.1
MSYLIVIGDDESRVVPRCYILGFSTSPRQLDGSGVQEGGFASAHAHSLPDTSELSLSAAPP